MEYWGESMKHSHLNYLILSDGVLLYLFERLSKKVPFEAYNRSRSLCTGESVEEILDNSPVPVFMIEKHPVEVLFND